MVYNKIANFKVFSKNAYQIRNNDFKNIDDLTKNIEKGLVSPAMMGQVRRSLLKTGRITTQFRDELIDDLLMDLRDSILHECNHMLEFYKRSLSGAGLINTSLSHSGRKNYNIPREIFEVWDEFMTMVYFSEPYEMRAMVQEMYSVRLRQPFEEFKKHRYYRQRKMSYLKCWLKIKTTY